MQSRTWTSSNNKWGVELVGNYTTIRNYDDFGVYAFLVQDQVNNHRDLIEVVIRITASSDGLTAGYEAASSAKVPSYVLKQIECMVWNGRWKGFEAATDLTPAEHDIMKNDIVRKHMPEAFLEEVKQQLAENDAAAAAHAAKKGVCRSIFSRTPWAAWYHSFGTMPANG